MVCVKLVSLVLPKPIKYPVFGDIGYMHQTTNRKHSAADEQKHILAKSKKSESKAFKTLLKIVDYWHYPTYPTVQI